MKNFIIAFISSFIGYCVGVFIKYKALSKQLDEVERQLQLEKEILNEMWEALKDED